MPDLDNVTDIGQKHTHTVFDDTYRTLSVKGTRLMIPLINYAFDENYSFAEEDICVIANEAGLPRVNTQPENASANQAQASESAFPAQERYITDSLFRVGEEDVFQLYILEEQTWAKNDIYLRLYQYMLSHANMHLVRMLEQDCVSLPQVGVLNLRNKQPTRHIKLKYGKKQQIDITAQIINLQDFRSIDEMEKHNLYCLMPYHMFLLDNAVRKQESDVLDRYIEEKEKYNAALQKALDEKRLSPDELLLLEEARKRNLSGLNWERFGVNTREMETMGGQVLELQFEIDRKIAYENGEKKGENRILQELKDSGLFDKKKLEQFTKAMQSGKSYSAAKHR